MLLFIISSKLHILDYSLWTMLALFAFMVWEVGVVFPDLVNISSNWGKEVAFHNLLEIPPILTNCFWQSLLTAALWLLTPLKLVPGSGWVQLGSNTGPLWTKSGKYYLISSMSHTMNANKAKFVNNRGVGGQNLGIHI